jgi:septal ring factor EnvC (AmiA/AmiB activator)
MGRVEGALATAASGRAEAWAKELRDELDDLSAALEQHIAITESPDGLLADIAEAAPRLTKRVERARDDHVALRASIERARASLTGAEDATHDARDLVVELLTALVRHRHLGADLVYEAYNVDIEASD